MEAGNTVATEALFQQIMDELVQAESQQPILLQFRHRISAHQYLRLYRLMAGYVGPGSIVLDWGTGNGHFSYFLLRAGYRAGGYDFGGPPCLYGRMLDMGYQFKAANAAEPSRLPFETESFEAVSSIGVLEHVRELGGEEAASLKEIHRLLKPGGVFICFHLPNRYSWIEGARRLTGRWTHPYRYTGDEVSHLVRSAGLTIIEVQRYALLPRNIWQRKCLKKVGNSNRIAGFYDILDDVLSTVMSPLCQNICVVARKPV